MTMMRTLRAQAADALREAITHEYQVGDRLPTEPELAKQMGLSRNTLREAITQLVSEGRLERRWGVGTTVLAPRETAAFSVTEVAPIRQIIAAAGRTPSIGAFRVNRKPAERSIADALNVPSESEVLHIERLFAIDDVPAILMRDWCLPEIGGVTVSVERLQDVNVELPALIRTQTGKVLDRMEGRIDVVPPAADFIAREDGPGAVVQISQTVFTRDDEPLLYSAIQFDTSVVDLTLRRIFTSP